MAQYGVGGVFASAQGLTCTAFLELVSAKDMGARQVSFARWGATVIVGIGKRDAVAGCAVDFESAATAAVGTPSCHPLAGVGGHPWVGPGAGPCGGAVGSPWGGVAAAGFGGGAL